MAMIIETENLGSVEIPGLTGMVAMTGNGNRLVVPEAARAKFPDAQCFEVICEDDRIVLLPMQLPTLDEVRAELTARGITEADVADAVAWARGKSPA